MDDEETWKSVEPVKQGLIFFCLRVGCAQCAHGAFEFPSVDNDETLYKITKFLILFKLINF